MNEYTVTALIEGDERVDVLWYQGDSLAAAIAAMASAAAHDPVDVDGVPLYRTLKVTLDLSMADQPEHCDRHGGPVGSDETCPCTPEQPEGFSEVIEEEHGTEVVVLAVTPEPDADVLICTLCKVLGQGHDGDHIAP